jgi:hypothetical protein
MSVPQDARCPRRDQSVATPSHSREADTDDESALQEFTGEKFFMRGLAVVQSTPVARVCSGENSTRKVGHIDRNSNMYFRANSRIRGLTFAKNLTKSVVLQAIPSVAKFTGFDDERQGP